MPTTALPQPGEARFRPRLFCYQCEALYLDVFDRLVDTLSQQAGR